MERLLKISIDEVKGTIMVDVPSRKERLKLVSAMNLGTDAKAINSEKIDRINEEVEKRILKVDLTVSEKAFEGLAEPEAASQIKSVEELDNSPVADGVYNYLTGVIMRGNLAKLTQDSYNQMLKG